MNFWVFPGFLTKKNFRGGGIFFKTPSAEIWFFSFKNYFNFASNPQGRMNPRLKNLSFLNRRPVF